MPYPYNNYYPYYPAYQQQSYSSNIKSMEWVDGKVGAQAYQMPQGWLPETPIALWDNSDKKIYLKSWNQMGMPNPLQELEYTIKERTNPALLPSNISGTEPQYATKEDFERLLKEIQDLKNTPSTGSRGGAK